MRSVLRVSVIAERIWNHVRRPSRLRSLLVSDITTRASRYSFDETVVRLTKAIADGGNTLFADIDQSAAASSVGMLLRPGMCQQV